MTRVRESARGDFQGPYLYSMLSALQGGSAYGCVFTGGADNELQGRDGNDRALAARAGAAARAGVRCHRGSRRAEQVRQPSVPGRCACGCSENPAWGGGGRRQGQGARGKGIAGGMLMSPSLPTARADRRDPQRGAGRVLRHAPRVLARPPAGDPARGDGQALRQMDRLHRRDHPSRPVPRRAARSGPQAGRSGVLPDRLIAHSTRPPGPRSAHSTLDHLRVPGASSPQRSTPNRAGSVAGARPTG